MDDDYEEPIWKKNACVASYSRNQTKFLNENLVDCNRKLYSDLFNENADKSIANEELRFSDEKQQVKKIRKKREKLKLEDIFKQSAVYEQLQKMKDKPLNIEQVDRDGKVLKRFEYYFDYEENKHDVVEIQNTVNKKIKNSKDNKRKAENDGQKVIKKRALKKLQDNNLNSSTVKIDRTFLFNRSSFDLSIIEKDKSFFANTSNLSLRLNNKFNRSLISQDNQIVDYSVNLNKLYTSFDETKNISLSCLQDLTAKDKILKFCKPNKIVKFNRVLNSGQKLIKIAEGAYGEVYRYDEDTILKVIKVEEDEYDQILPEIIVSFILNELQKKFKFNNFIKLKKCSFVQDKYSDQLLTAWTDYDKRIKKSENPNPTDYDENSLFILLFLNDGGKDLETFKELEPKTAISIFEQVLLSLAIAEYSIQLEHRDLHLGNILIKEIDKNEVLTYKLNNRTYKIQSNGVKINIIDYSLTRFTRNKVTIYQNLNDCPEIFEGKGEIQYEVYRKMKKLTNDNWHEFCPSTNIVWLDYLLTKLIHAIGTKRRSSDEKKLVCLLRRWKANLKKFNSCLEALELIE